jgi:hypothetical protein
MRSQIVDGLIAAFEAHEQVGLTQRVQIVTSTYVPETMATNEVGRFVPAMIGSVSRRRAANYSGEPGDVEAVFLVRDVGELSLSDRVVKENTGEFTIASLELDPTETVISAILRRAR